jgi:hypothetical protein
VLLLAFGIQITVNDPRSLLGEFLSVVRHRFHLLRQKNKKWEKSNVKNFHKSFIQCSNGEFTKGELLTCCESPDSRFSKDDDFSEDNDSSSCIPGLWDLVDGGFSVDARFKKNI